MAYSDFTNIAQVEKQFGVHQTLGTIFGNVSPIYPSENLRLDLLDIQQMPLINSEKAKSEFLIVPILKEIRRHSQRFSIFSGYTFDVDEELSLVGICDYILSSHIDSLEIKSAIFCLVEAKNRTTTEGIPQVAAEMIAAQIFNDREQNNVSVIYGCVTTGTEWIFLKLVNKTLTVDTKRYYISDNELPTLLGALNTLVTQAILD
jgi:hypothetical protein